jgi:tryptophanase
VPILRPFGGHAIYIDAKRFLPHIPQSEFPGQSLVCALYMEGGIRGVEIGSLMFAERDPETGECRYPDLELVRLAIPRRVYTMSQLEYVAEVTGKIYRNRDKLHGLRITYEAPFLRHFTARLEPL